MGLPSKKRTPRSKKDRASHAALKKVQVGKCVSCGANSMAHKACPTCGMYRGRKGIDTKKRTMRALRKTKKHS